MVLWSVGAVAVAAALMLAVVGRLPPAGASQSPHGNEELRKQMNETFRQGNYKDAYEGFRKLALDPAERSPPGGRRPEHGRPVP